MISYLCLECDRTSEVSKTTLEYKMVSSNIILVGLMGSGKSTIGRKLSEICEMDFYDSDILIEQKTGKTIAQIFSEEGEPAFRQHEQAVIDNILQKNKIILATGGGAILNAKSRALFKTHGTVFYLTASIDILLQRAEQALAHRPLLHVANPREKLETLLLQREAWYLEAANHVISTENKSVDLACGEIYSIWKHPPSL